MMDRGETVRLIVPKIFKIAFNLISTIFNYIYIMYKDLYFKLHQGQK